MKRLLAIPMTVVALMTVAVPASAGRPDTASGDWDYVPTSIEVVPGPGQTTFVYGEDIGTWSGTFVGTSTEEFVIVNHAKAGFNFYSGVIEFTGSVDGRVGTLTIKTNGKQDPGTVQPGPGLWFGHWVIVGGTGDLANLHGQGTFNGPSLFLDYDGQYHFS